MTTIVICTAAKPNRNAPNAKPALRRRIVAPKSQTESFEGESLPRNRKRNRLEANRCAGIANGIVWRRIVARESQTECFDGNSSPEIAIRDRGTAEERGIPSESKANMRDTNGMRISRRDWMTAMAGALIAPGVLLDASPEIAAIEKRLGGRLGVAALDTGSGRRIEHRATERFALCSTFKFLASAAVLARVDQKKERLDRVVRYGPKDLLEYAPVTKEHVGEGMTVEALMAAAVEYSDNTAANLLLASLGGPKAVTAFARSIGDTVTRLDRNEPALNEVPAGEVRDTTSPASIVHDLQALLVDSKALSESSRTLLTKWMVGCTTGDDRLRAGLPKDWRIGDKTGTGPHGATNDVAIAWPPDGVRRAPILIAAYFWGSTAPADDRSRALADVGRIVAASR